MTDFDVLLIEDDSNVQLGCVQTLELEDIHTIAVGSVNEARKYLPDLRHHGIVVTDMKLPGTSGVDFQKSLNQEIADLPVIIITGHGNIETAVSAMQNGAYDFLPKPFTPQQFTNVVRRALDKRRLTLELVKLRRQLAENNAPDSKLVGHSPEMDKLRETIRAIAATPANVMINGETGTGKELVARCIHELSGRSGPFVALNCGGLPDTLFDSEIFGHESGAFSGATRQRIGKVEFANKGTLFLDEIESMPLTMQIKLLRVLQERQLERLGSNQSIDLDIRVITASKADLQALAREGKFREDLHFRLDVVHLNLPPLRERREDIPLLFALFSRQAAQTFQRPAPVLNAARQQALTTHNWPGNVRELRNEAERFVLGLCPEEEQISSHTLAQSVESFEKGLIKAELERHQGNLSQAADALQVAKSTLADKIKKYQLK